MSEQCRLHYDLATGKGPAPDTSDKGGGFVGPGGANGNVYGPGENQAKNVKEYNPPDGGSAHSNY